MKKAVKQFGLILIVMLISVFAACGGNLPSAENAPTAQSEDESESQVIDTDEEQKPEETDASEGNEEEDNTAEESAETSDTESMDVFRKLAIGNTCCNIANDGKAASDGKYIYYSTMTTLEKIKMIGGVKEVLVDDCSVLDINVAGKWVFFSGNVWSVDDGKLGFFKIRTDGTGLTRIPIPDKDGYGESYRIIEDWLYYIWSTWDSDHNKRNYELHRFDLEENSDVLLASDVFFYDVSGNLLYCLNEDGTIFCLCEDGTQSIIIEGIDANEYYTYFCVLDGWIYYNDTYIYRVKTDGTEKTRICEVQNCDCFNVTGDQIFIASYDPEVLYKVSITGEGLQKFIEGYCINIVIVEDWIYFLMNDIEVCRMRLDGLQHETIYELIPS